MVKIKQEELVGEDASGPQIGEAAAEDAGAKRGRESPLASENHEEDGTTSPPKKRAKTQNGEAQQTASAPKKRPRKENGEGDGAELLFKKSRKESHKPSEKTKIKTISVTSRKFVNDILGLSVPDSKFRKDGELKAKGAGKVNQQTIDEARPMLNDVREFHNNNVGATVPCTELDLLDFAIRRCCEDPLAQVCTGIDSQPMRTCRLDLAKKAALRLGINLKKYDFSFDDALANLCEDVIEQHSGSPTTSSLKDMKEIIRATVATVRRLRDQLLGVLPRHPFLKSCSQSLKANILDFVAALYNDKIRMRVLYLQCITPQRLRDEGLEDAEIAELLCLPIHKEFRRDQEPSTDSMRLGYQYAIKNQRFAFDGAKEGDDEDDQWGEIQQSTPQNGKEGDDEMNINDQISDEESEFSEATGEQVKTEPDDGEVGNFISSQSMHPRAEGKSLASHNGEVKAQEASQANHARQFPSKAKALSAPKDGELVPPETYQSALQALQPWHLTTAQLRDWMQGKSVRGLPPLVAFKGSQMIEENIAEIREALHQNHNIVRLPEKEQTLMIFACLSAFILSRIGEFRDGKIVKFLKPYKESNLEEPKVVWPADLEGSPALNKAAYNDEEAIVAMHLGGAEETEDSILIPPEAILTSVPTIQRDGESGNSTGLPEEEEAQDTQYGEAGDGILAHAVEQEEKLSELQHSSSQPLRVPVDLERQGARAPPDDAVVTELGNPAATIKDDVAAPGNIKAAGPQQEGTSNVGELKSIILPSWTRNSISSHGRSAAEDSTKTNFSHMAIRGAQLRTFASAVLQDAKNGAWCLHVPREEGNTANASSGELPAPNSGDENHVVLNSDDKPATNSEDEDREEIGSKDTGTTNSEDENIGVPSWDEAPATNGEDKDPENATRGEASAANGEVQMQMSTAGDGLWDFSALRKDSLEDDGEVQVVQSGIGVTSVSREGALPSDS